MAFVTLQSDRGLSLPPNSGNRGVFLRIESFVIRLAAVCCLVLLVPPAGRAQEPVRQPSTPPPPAPLPPKSQDYPDPQGLTFGVFYWAAIPGQEPDLKTGKTAGQFEDILNIGKPKQAPGVQVSYPITRTGTIWAEGLQLKGAGAETIPA